jgi:hypothetical protein
MAGSSPTPRKAAAKKATTARQKPLAPGDERDLTEGPEIILDLDALDKADYVPDAVLKPFAFKHADRIWTLMDPRDLDWRDLMRGLRNPAAFMGMAMPEGDQEAFLEQPCPGWKMDAIFTNWQAHYKVTGLGDLNGLLAS